MNYFISWNYLVQCLGTEREVLISVTLTAYACDVAIGRDVLPTSAPAISLKAEERKKDEQEEQS